MDFIESLGSIALGSRLRRISDQLSAQVSGILCKLELDFEPKWFPLFSLLSIKGDTTIVEAASQLGVTQPAISQFSRELLAVDLIEIKKDPNDSRKRILSLSPSGNQLVQHLRPIWLSIQKSIEDVANEQEIDVLRSLQKFEEGFRKKSLMERTLEHMKNADTHPIKIIGYSARYKKDFKRLNDEWIDKMFKREPIDDELLNHPEEKVLKEGGKIFFAVLPTGEAIGTCALKPDKNGEFELSKMAVTKKMQGQRIGEMLLRRCLWQVKMMGKKSLYLLTSTDCKAAIHVYKKLGFKDAPKYLETYTDYERANVAMEYTF